MPGTTDEETFTPSVRADQDSRRWWWSTAEESLAMIDPTGPVSFHSLMLTGARHDGHTLVLTARRFLNGSREFWRGLSQVDGQLRVWEQAMEQEEGEVAEDKEDNSPAESEGGEANVQDDDELAEGEPDMVDGTGGTAPGATEASIDTGGAAPGATVDNINEVGPPKARGRPIRIGSDLEWARSLVPGHPANGSVVPDGVEACSLNRVTRSATGVMAWVARYSGSAPILSQRKFPAAAKMGQKTRSMTFEGTAAEHDAFRVALQWLLSLIHI